MALATQLPRPGSGVFFTLTLATEPMAATFTEIFTSPFAFALSPHALMRPRAWPTPSDTAARAGASGRLESSPPPPPPPVSGLGFEVPPPPPPLYCEQHAGW